LGIWYFRGMHKLTSVSLFFLAAGILTSVTVLSAYQVLFTVAVFYFTYQAYKDKDLKLPMSAYWLLAFSFVALISTTINIDIIPKPSKNFGRIKYFLYGVGGIYVFRYWLKEATDKAKKIIANTFFLSILVTAAYSIWQFYFSGLARATGFTETMRYGYGSAMILLITLSAILNREKMGKWFDYRAAIIVFVLGFIGMYLTYTRGALFSFLCGLPFVLYFYKPKLGLTLGAIAAFGAILMSGLYLFGTTKYESRFLANKDSRSDVIRRSQWKSALIAIQEKPVLGWGLSNFHTQVKRIKDEHNLDAKEYIDAHSHNLFLEIASGTGIIGLIVFLGWLVSWSIEAFKAKGLVRALIVPLGVAFVVSSQFEVTFDANNASMIFFLYAMSSALKTVLTLDGQQVELSKD
jgi:O-antigen ligase